MDITAVRTQKVLPGALSIFELLDEALLDVEERDVVVVTSKVVSLCENNVVPIEGTDKTKLLQDEAELYVEPSGVEGGDYFYNFTIKQNTLIPASGIDASNGNGSYILWPKDPMASAHAIRDHLLKRYGLKELGVVITDSTISLSRWGTLGIAIAHSGFNPIKNYIGQPDVFGRELKLSKANVAGGLAAAAVLVMGEGAEQTPLAVVKDVDFVQFWDHDDPASASETYYISPLDDDPFKPFFGNVAWKRGGSYKD